MEFRVGDKVVCVDPYAGHLVEGIVYTVRELREGTPDIWLKEHRMSWDSRRFRLFDSGIAAQGYMELFQ